jgi:hypothetical protein
MKNENVKSEVKKEQLLSEQAFINYCNYDEANIHGGRVSRLDIDQRFIRAAEKDGFIKPLLKTKELVKQNDGTEKLEMVSYYSPFQIFLVSELSKNIIDENGYLRSPSDLEWQKEKNFRWVNWGGGMSLTIDKKRRWERNPKFASENLPLFCDYFHRFLAFIHTFELKPNHIRDIEERRHFTRLPSVSYNFELLKDGGLKLLKKHRLDTKILNLLRKEVAQLATVIDPLEHWYYYIKRHTQFRKDLLKGDAALAQEIYRIYDLVTIIVETITGEKSKPLFDFLYPDITPFLIQKVNYQSGEDVKALQFAIQQFKEWSGKKENKHFVNNEAIEKLNAVENKIKDYEQRYGDRSYAGNLRTIETEEKIKLDDLDEETKKDVENTLKQMKEQKMKVELGQEISQAIEHRLWELQRELQEIFWDIGGKLRDRENEWWQKERNFHNIFWMANREKLAKLPREEQLKLSRKELDKIVKEAKKWDERGKVFAYSVSKYADLVFCRVCRKNPVQLHIENNNLNMWEVSRSVICDECIQKASDPRELKGAEWKCDYCGSLIYKFAHNNILSDLLINTVSANINLEYGKMTIVARCPNSKCKRENTRTINWGWMP